MSRTSIADPGEERKIEPSLPSLILDTINALVVVLDSQGRIVFFNKASESLTGYDFDEVRGKRVWDFLLVPEEADDVRAVFLALRDGDQPNSHENAWVTKNGRRRLIEWSNTAITSGDGALRYVIGTGVDVTERRQVEEAVRESETRLRSILDTAPEAIITIDERGIIETFSAAAERLFGYLPEEVIGRNVGILMPPPYGQEDDDYIARYLKTDETRVIGTGREVVGKRKDGSLFPMELSLGEVDPEGERRFTGFVRDLTARHKMEQELLQAHKMEAVGQLTGGVAHDFNNLLTIIMGNLERLEPRVTEDERSRHLVKQVQEAAELGAELTGRLLAFARRQPLQPEVIDLNRLVRGMDGLLRRTLGESIQIRTSLAEDLARTRTDPGQVENALLNLAINARDAMQGGGTLTIGTANMGLDADDAYLDSTPGDYVVLSVSDTGVGMSPETRERALEPFFTTKNVGSGLGLSTVYGFAKQSGGYCQIYSELGIGTTVNLYLPQLKGAEAGKAVRHGREDEPPGRGELVLVVEDDPRVRSVTVERLVDLGYVVVEADSGAAALAKLTQEPPVDLLFSDFVMPGGMNGADLASEAQRQFPGIKVLFTSGYADLTGARGEAPAEDAAWIRKPYKRAALARKIREVLDA